MPRTARPPTGPTVPNPNRLDLNSAANQGPPPAPAQAIRVAPGGPQGSRQAMEQMQQAQPLPDSDAQMQQATTAAQGMSLPPAFDRPTEHPDEPLTAGMDTGAGPGYGETTRLTPPQMPPSDQQAMAPWLPMLELLASKPGTSQGTRNTVRILRSSLPPGYDYTQH